MEKKNPDAIAICLNCYKIKFNEKNRPLQKTVTDVFGAGNLIDIMQGFISAIDAKKVFKNTKADRILYLKETLKASKTENIYAGVIMKGHNGPETSIDELVKNEVKNVGTVTKDQFHCLPYFFLLYLNKDKPNDLILIAQSYRQFGFKEVFEDAFRTYTDSLSQNVTVSFNTLSIASLFEKYINDGLINKMRFIKHGLQKGTENIVRGDKLEDSNYEMEMSIKSKKGFWGIKQSLKYDDSSFIEQVQLQGFEFDEAYADIFIAGRKRVVNITKPTHFSAAYDITDEVEINKDSNLPNFKNILEQALDVLNNDLIPYV
jgi:hypothetical protein